MCAPAGAVGAASAPEGRPAARCSRTLPQVQVHIRRSRGTTSAIAGGHQGSTRMAARVQAVSTTTSAATPAPAPLASETASAPASTAQKKLLVGREVEEAAMWDQIKLHEAWDSGERRNSNAWQGPQLEQAYERCDAFSP